MGEFIAMANVVEFIFGLCVIVPEFTIKMANLSIKHEKDETVSLSLHLSPSLFISRGYKTKPHAYAYPAPVIVAL